MASPKKSLGQHWLKDRATLETIAGYANIQAGDTVLEIGPGLGTLTSTLLRAGARVMAVEFDPALARKLPAQFPRTDLQVFCEDFLMFDLSRLPRGYKAVGNIPYYITGKIIQTLLMAGNTPSLAVLLVQEEVAERVAAIDGKHSLLSLSCEVFADVSLGNKVSRAMFTPPPQVDSRVVILRPRPQSLIAPEQQPAFFRVVKAGFSAKRKKLRSSLSGGLALSKEQVLSYLKEAAISPDDRAENLTVRDWQRLSEIIE